MIYPKITAHMWLLRAVIASFDEGEPHTKTNIHKQYSKSVKGKNGSDDVIVTYACTSFLLAYFAESF